MWSKFCADAKRGSSVFIYCSTVNTSNPSASNKLFCTYLAEIQSVTTCIKSMDSSPHFHVCECQQKERLEELQGWWEWQSLFWQMCNLKLTHQLWNHILTLFCNLLPLTCYKFGNNFLSSNVLAFDLVSIKTYGLQSWIPFSETSLLIGLALVLSFGKIHYFM